MTRKANLAPLSTAIVTRHEIAVRDAAAELYYRGVWNLDNYCAFNEDLQNRAANLPDDDLYRAVFYEDVIDYLDMRGRRAR